MSHSHARHPAAPRSNATERCVYLCRLAAALFLALTSLVPTACTTRKADDFIPEEVQSRQALTTALTAWKTGGKWEKIPGGGTTIEVLDNKWRAGQQLADFQILAADPPSDGPQWFTVKLVMKKPAGELKVRYVVVGIDPLWVYREEDYKKNSGM